jgi:predicted transposase/invertase (TIGR01784 family)
MPELTNPHDRFFKEVFGRPEVAADFLQHYLPPELGRLLDPDPRAWRLRPGSFVDRDLRAHESDLLYQARLRDGTDTLAYVLFEHKSWPERLVALQLLRYLVQIAERDARAGRPLLPVLPIVVYHGQAPWRVPSNSDALFTGPDELRPYWPTFRFEVIDLSHLHESEIAGAVMTRAAARLLASIYDPDLRDELPDILGLLRELEDEREALAMLRTMMAYVARASEAVTQEDMERAIRSALPDQGGDIVPTMAEKWLQQGIERGVAQGTARGRELGLEQGLRDGLLGGIELALEVKFGADGLALMPEIAAVTDNTTLRAVRDAIRTARTVEDVRRACR